jgi:hypothetical protein
VLTILFDYKISFLFSIRNQLIRNSKLPDRHENDSLRFDQAQE